MKIYLVGGAVRDELLNLSVKDRDWVVTGATPRQMLKQGYRPVGKDFPVFLHPETGEEYALARTERKEGHGYGGFTFYTAPGVLLEEDLKRRDLTINAIAKDQSGQIIDPYRGQQDIEKKILRHVSPAFAEDPLRVLRIARFAARFSHLGFTIADETLQLMRSISASGELQFLTAERVWQETSRALGEKNPEVFFDTIIKCGALQPLFPELSDSMTINFSAMQKALSSATKNGLSAESRFSCFVMPSLLRCTKQQYFYDENILHRFCQQMKLPVSFKDNLSLSMRMFNPWVRLLPDAESLLQFMEQADPFRRPERFHALLEHLRLFEATVYSDSSSSYDGVQKQKWLIDAVNICQHISVHSLVEQGYNGAQLGSAIKSERLLKLKSYLKNSPQS